MPSCISQYQNDVPLQSQRPWYICNDLLMYSVAPRSITCLESTQVLQAGADKKFWFVMRELLPVGETRISSTVCVYMVVAIVETCPFRSRQMRAYSVPLHELCLAPTWCQPVVVNTSKKQVRYLNRTMRLTLKKTNRHSSNSCKRSVLGLVPKTVGLQSVHRSPEA